MAAEVTSRARGRAEDTAVALHDRSESRTVWYIKDVDGRDGKALK